jgi:hypothetical protein
MLQRVAATSEPALFRLRSLVVRIDSISCVCPSRIFGSWRMLFRRHQLQRRHGQPAESPPQRYQRLWYACSCPFGTLQTLLELGQHLVRSRLRHHRSGDERLGVVPIAPSLPRFEMFWTVIVADPSTQ